MGDSPVQSRNEPEASLHQDALASLDVGICVWELETPDTPSSLRLVACNRAAGIFFGIPHTELLGKLIDDAFPGALKTPLPGLFTKIIQTNQDMPLGEVPYGDQIVEPGVFAIHAHPLEGNRCCVEFTNITQRKHAEKQVAERTAQLTKTLADLWSEMDLARKIQTVLLPTEPQIAGYDVAARMRPAETVGGDYFDIVQAGDVDWLLIGDVSGHGISAGLIMMMVQTAVRTAILGCASLRHPSTPSEVVVAVNSAIRSNLQKIGKDQYMTFNALRLTGGRVCHAGLHQDILVYRASAGNVEIIETSGAWLGVVDDIQPLSNDLFFDLNEGDALLLFTDGLIEMRETHPEFDQKRLAASFAELASANRSAAEIVDAILENASGDLRDDISLVVARRRGGDGSSS
jgi:serine phosphatase RsbU (regulator of sigma subunit)